MKVVCPECKSSELSITKNRGEEIDYKKGTVQIVKDLSCDCCGTLFLATMDIEITDFEAGFIIAERKEKF